MTDSPVPRDLIAVVADGDTEAALRAVLVRHDSLQIRPITVDIQRHLHRDAGCRSDAHNLLRLSVGRYLHALVVFDHEGSGREMESAPALEAEVEQRLAANGWDDRAAAIVVEPELEAWVWSDSSEVDAVLGWSGRSPSLRQWLHANPTWWPRDRKKPTRHKEALDGALRAVMRQRSQTIFEDLASRVALSRCIDPSFTKLKLLLRDWFGT